MRVNKGSLGHSTLPRFCPESAAAQALYIAAPLPVQVLALLKLK